jgi:hypothetical protein
MVDIIAERVDVSTDNRDEKGHQIDPEEHPAQEVLTIESPLVSLSNGQVAGRLAGGGEVDIIGTALQFASGYQHRCRNCKNFNNDLFVRIKKEIDNSTDIEEVKSLDQLRGLLLENGHAEFGNDNDLDIEAALMEWGICEALCEVYKEVVCVHPEAGCPDYPGPGGEDLTTMFKPRSTEARREGDALYDRILTAAKGQHRSVKGKIIMKGK